MILRRQRVIRRWRRNRVTENFPGQDEVKGDHVGYRHGLNIKHLRSKGILVEKRRGRFSLLDVDVTAYMS